MDKNTYDFIVQNLKVLKENPREMLNIDIVDKAIWYTESLMSASASIRKTDLDSNGAYVDMLEDMALNEKLEIADKDIEDYRDAVDLGLQCFMEEYKNGFNE
jgi:hypothetical protein